MSFKLGQISLKDRLFLVFSGILALVIIFAASLLMEQHRIAATGSQIAVRAHQEMGNAIQLRESLSEIERMAKLSEVDTLEIVRFRRLMKELQSGLIGGDAVDAFQRMQARFDNYISALSDGVRNPVTIRTRYEDAAAAVSSFIELNQDSIYRMAERLRTQQEHSMRVSVIMLFCFILVSGAAGMKIISVITRPLSGLARYVDHVDVEKGLPDHIEQFKTDLPEIAVLARSFELLLERLKGYRAVNVRKLLVEKRRADIIAASISDGILLLHDDEILYINPVGERILGLPAGSFGPLPTPGKVLTLSSLVPVTGTGAAAADKKSTPLARGAHAIISAVFQTMPVELEIQFEDRKQHFLVQAYPISDALIEKLQISGQIGQAIEEFQANTIVVAQDMTLVRESQEAKGHFLATLSHEVKTPVTSLTLATRMLKKVIEEFPNPTHRTLIQTCADDVDRLRGLLDELLTASRFDTLTQRIEYQSADIAKLVRHSVQSFQPQAAERGIELEFQHRTAGKKSVVVPMDPTKIAWAISNLLTNAVRHTPRGGKVEVQIEPGEGWVEVHIRDNGPGIDKRRQDRIFDKFNSFYDIRVARTGSAGVGLAIAREIVQAHGGRIWVSSEPGRGAEFCFMLPLKAKNSDAIVEESDRKNLTNLVSLKGASGGTSARS